MTKKIILDVTCLLNSRYVTGIQRCVLELATRFIKSNLDIILAYCSAQSSAFEFDILDNNKFLKRAYSINNKNRKFLTSEKIKINKLNENYIWLDIDAVWDSSTFRREILYKRLKSKKVHIVTLIHDLLVLKYPEFFDKHENLLLNYLLYFTAVIQYSDIILTTTESIKSEVLYHLQKCNINKPIFSIKSGCNLKNEVSIKSVSYKIKQCVSSRYILMVGTIEPRKNHYYLYNNFLNRLLNEKVNLIFAGKPGWMCKDLIKKITSNKLYNKRLFFFNTPNDDEIIYLYKHAFAFCFPSFSEGYGLPIVESIYYNCPVFVSDIPVFREITGNKAIYFDIKSEYDFAEKILPYLHSKKDYLFLKKSIKNIRIYNWDDTFAFLLKRLSNVM